MKCLLYGYKRGTLVSTPEKKAAENQIEFAEADRVHSPSRLYNVMITTMSDSLLQVFPHNEHKQDATNVKLHKEKLQLIENRKNQQ